jgi:hypothetical protein
MNVLLYRMKQRKHIYVKYCWQTYGTLSQIFKNHIVAVACKWCIQSTSDVFLSRNDNSGGKTREASEVVEYDFYFTEYDFLSCVITCSDFYLLSIQINLLMVINLWGIIIYIYCMLVREIWKLIHPRVSYSLARGEYDTRGWINFHISCTSML